MGWEFLASSGPTVVLMTNSEEHLGVPRSISSLGRLGTTADAMRPLISVSTSDGPPAKRVSESGSCHLHSNHSWMRCGLASTGMGLLRTDPEGNQSAQILHTPLETGISSRKFFAQGLCGEPQGEPALFLVHITSVDIQHPLLNAARFSYLPTGAKLRRSLCWRPLGCPWRCR